jgi:hypothetical protein
MFEKIFRKLISDIKEELIKEIRDNAKDICREMIEELLLERDEEEYAYFEAGGSYFTREKRKTMVGVLKDGIKKKVMAEMEESIKIKTMEHIRGEDFIDSVVDRILRKQITKG